MKIVKKYSFVLLAFVIGLTACHKKVNLKAEWEGLYERTTIAFDSAETPAEQEAILTNMVDSAYLLLEKNIKAPYADTLFSNVYYLFTQEQKQALFAKMPKRMLEQENIAEMHHVFLLEVATSQGNPYTDIIALQPNGDELSLSELVGKTDYVLVDFWASWCRPCRRLIPVLKEIYAGQPEGRLQILSCSCDRDESAWRKALEEENMPWPQMREGEGQYECTELYGVQSIPTTILINRDGLIIARNPDESELEAILWGNN